MSEAIDTSGTPQPRTAHALRYIIPAAIAVIGFIVFTAYSVWINLPVALPTSGPDAASVLRSSLNGSGNAAPGLVCDQPAPRPDLATSPFGAWTLYRPAGLHGGTLAGVHSIATRVISTRTLEQRYGIRITLVGITNLGSMVELRFKVLDRDKALQLLSGNGHAAMPMMMLAGTTKMLEKPHMMHEKHGIDMKPRGMNFIYYPNGSGILKSGDKVSLTFGNVQVTPVTVQG
jgi:hypothetical protein